MCARVRVCGTKTRNLASVPQRGVDPKARQGKVRRADVLTCAVSSRPPGPAVMHMCSGHKYLIVCSCQPPLIGLMLPEEQPKAALVADV